METALLNSLWGGNNERSAMTKVLATSSVTSTEFCHSRKDNNSLQRKGQLSLPFWYTSDGYSLKHQIVFLFKSVMPTKNTIFLDRWNNVNDHRIMAYSKLEGTQRIIKSNSGLHTGLLKILTIFLRVLSKHAELCQLGVVPTALGSLFQCPTTLLWRMYS